MILMKKMLLVHVEMNSLFYISFTALRYGLEVHFKQIQTYMISIGVSGDDGRSRAMQLQLLLKRLDEYAFSSEQCERERAVHAVLALLHHFRALYIPGSCKLNCSGGCIDLGSISVTGHIGLAGDC